ncbi:MAG: hypothetical protein ACNA8W_15970 [Bradymonadaceae bacterium]
MYLDESVGYQPTPEAELRTTSLGAGHWESELRAARVGDATARTVYYWLSQLTFFHFHDTLDEDALETWLEDYSLSEVFDKGVIGGRP